MKKSPEYDGPQNLPNRMDPTLKFLGRGSKFRVPGQFFPSGSNCVSKSPSPLGAFGGESGTTWGHFLASLALLEIEFEIDFR